MLGEVSLALAAIITLCCSLVIPSTCPRGWYVEGVRPSGVSRCRPVPPRHCGEPVPPHNVPCPVDERELPVLVCCTGGSRAIVVNERTIGCTR